jgi:type II secretory pathway pseudopilin PulG
MQRLSGPRFRPTRNQARHSFTLVELIVAIGIFAIILIVLLQMVSQTTKIWQQTTGVSANRENARLLLQLMGRDLQTAVFPITSSNNLQFQVNPASLNGSTYLNPSAAFWQAAVSGTTAASGDIQDVGYFINWIPDGSGVVHGTFCRIQVPRPATNSATPPLTITPAILYADAPGLANTDLSSPTAYQGLLADDVMGLWITLYSANMASTNLPSAAYNSRTASFQPAYADIGIVMMDPAVARHINAGNLASITGLYTSSACTNAASFANLLPASFKVGAHSFTTRVQLKNVP